MVIGEGKVLKDFENTVRTMSVGEKKSVEILCEKAYGEVNPEAIVKSPRNEFPKGFRFIIDERIQGNTKSGKPGYSNYFGSYQNRSYLRYEPSFGWKRFKF